MNTIEAEAKARKVIAENENRIYDIGNRFEIGDGYTVVAWKETLFDALLRPIKVVNAKLYLPAPPLEIRKSFYLSRLNS